MSVPARSSSPRLRMSALLIVLALLTPACFLRSLVGHVTVETIAEEVDLVRAALSANATIGICRDVAFEGRGVECTYIINGQQVVSSFALIADFGLFGVLIDPLVLQVPTDVITVDGTFNYRGQDEPLDVTLTGSFSADSTTTITAEPGMQFAILELPTSVQDEVTNAPEAEPIGVDYSVEIQMPRLEPLVVKPMYTVRVDAGGQIYYPPMLPCVTDFADVPTIEVPVADSPSNLLDNVETALELAQPCDGQTYTFTDEGPAQGPVARISGPDRIATAIEVSRATWPQTGQAAAVVLARADAFPDALSGTPLAWALAAPILLTNSDALDSRVAEEIARVIPTDFEVYVLGGTAAISPAVVAAVEALGYRVTRIGGSNRFETAVAVADFVTTPPDTVYLADGGTFPAALLGGAAATMGNARVLLTSGADLAPATQAWIIDHPSTQRIAVGDAAATADPEADAVTGDIATMSVALARRAWGAAPSEVFLASDTVFADGLSAGPLTGPRPAFATYTGGPLLLTDPQTLPQPIVDYLAEIGPTVQRAAIIGGTAAVGDSVAAEAAAALQ